MFGIGMPEMLLILAIALIVIGPQKLPDLAKSLGRAIAEFKRATAEIKETMEIDNELKSVQKTFENIDADIKKDIENIDAEIKKNVSPGVKPSNRTNDGSLDPDQDKTEPQPQNEDPKDV